MVDRLKVIALVLLLALPLGAQSKSSGAKACIIAHEHTKRAAEVLHRWTQPKPFDYVEGDFPKGVKFHYEFGDGTIRQVQASGGKVVTMKADYALPDLEDARKTCKAFQEAK